MIEVAVSRLGVDASSKAFVLILEEVEGDRTLPVWIGPNEAESIAAHLNDIKRPRPMTHDLIQSIISGLGGLLRRVQITKVMDKTFFGEMHITRGGQNVIIDSRPSDAIAVAVRLGAPIFVAESVLDDDEDEVGGDDSSPVDEDHLSAEELKRHLAQLRPEDFGRFVP